MTPRPSQAQLHVQEHFKGVCPHALPLPDYLGASHTLQGGSEKKTSLLPEAPRISSWLLVM